MTDEEMRDRAAKITGADFVTHGNALQCLNAVSNGQARATDIASLAKREQVLAAFLQGEGGLDCIRKALCRRGQGQASPLTIPQIRAVSFMAFEDAAARSAGCSLPRQDSAPS